MKALIRNLLLLTATVPLFLGCSERPEPQPATYSQLLTGTTQKAWRLVSVRVIDDWQDSGPINIGGLLAPCEADDQYVFFANAERRFEYQDGLSKCDPTDPNILLSATWSLVNASASLEMPIPPFFGGAALPLTIKSLSETSLVVELYFDRITPDRLNASYRFTFNSSTR